MSNSTPEHHLDGSDPDRHARSAGLGTPWIHRHAGGEPPSGPSSMGHLPTQHPLGATGKRRGTILVYDNQPLSLIALAGVLDAQGFSCICAKSESAACEAVTAGCLDALVCDVEDDAPEALRVLERLRGHDLAGALPAVLIADQRWVGLERQIEPHAANTRCLFKPIDPHALVAVVDQLLLAPGAASSARTQARRPGWITL